VSERISIVIPEEMKGEIEVLQKMTHLDKSSLIRQLLRKSIREFRIEEAIKAYEEGKVSFGKASEIAGLNMWEWIDEVHRRGVHMQLSIEDARQEIEAWKKDKHST
jgi:predicted HTH domain antitoxin